MWQASALKILLVWVIAVGALTAIFVVKENKHYYSQENSSQFLTKADVSKKNLYSIIAKVNESTSTETSSTATTETTASPFSPTVSQPSPVTKKSESSSLLKKILNIDPTNSQDKDLTIEKIPEKNTTPTAPSSQYTLAEVALHSTASDCWIIVNSNVYSVASYLSLHPGGRSVILNQCGKNATTAFTNRGGTGSHSSSAWSLLNTFLIGTYTTAPSPIAGVCGAANNVTFSSAPTTGLCTTGSATAVTGTGPWDWTCSGSNGGASASCSALKGVPTPVDGSCGSANGVSTLSSPTAGLCSAGSATSVTPGASSFTWSCNGLNGGTSASCAAPLTKIAGSCGSSNGGSFTSAPSTGLCSVGSQSAVTGTGPWDWTCSGSNGGASASCSASKILSSQYTLTEVALHSTASDCWIIVNSNVYSVASYLSLHPGGRSVILNQCGKNATTAFTNRGGTGSHSSSAWSLLNTFLIGTYTTAPSPIAGVCGAANNVTFSSAPTTGLCTTGSATAVTGTGPWDWTCSGSNGGASASCSALKGVPTPVDGVCGTSNGGSFSSTPSTNLCSVGSAAGMSGAGPWSWTCTGTNGGNTASCSAELSSVPPPPQTYTISVTSQGNYSQTSITINKGDSITFVYTPPISDEVVTKFTPSGISSITLDSEFTQKTKIFTTSGTWTFKASDHSGNTGTVIVQ